MPAPYVPPPMSEIYKPRPNVQHGAGVLSDYVSDNVNRAGDAMASFNDNICLMNGVSMNKSGLLKDPKVAGAGACVFANLSSEALQKPGMCSKDNDSLYDANFADVVEDISITKPDSAVMTNPKCVVKFKIAASDPSRLQGTADPSRVREYDQHLADKQIEATPEYITLDRKYKALLPVYAGLQDTLRNLTAELNDETTRGEKCRTTTLPSAQTQLEAAKAAASAEMSACAQQLAECKAKG
jgi:hypothetical protein